MSSVFLLIHDPVIAARMRAVVLGMPGLSVCGWVNKLAQARTLIAQTRPSLVLADLRLADGAFETFQEELATTGRYGRPRIVVNVESLDDPRLLQAISEGADGFFLLGRGTEGLRSALRQALADEAEMPPAIARQVKAHFDNRVWEQSDFVREAQNPLSLTDVERLMLVWLAEGFSAPELMREFRIDERELGRRIRTLYRKMRYDCCAEELSLAA